MLKKIAFSLLVISLSSCGLIPQNVDMDNNETLPEIKTTAYDKAIQQYGLMQDIFDVRQDATGRDKQNDFSLRVMVKDIADVTGAASGSQNEIPNNITEMVHSTLNAIGGRILYIPYDPNFLSSLNTLGYINLDGKKLPDIVISGGITEFDRGLVTKGESSNIAMEMGKEYGVDFSDKVKSSLASITLDFNLIDFKTQAGIPKMQAINSVKVHKGTREDNLAFTIKGATFGAQGEIKKVEGRHAAVRLIVQMSMLQILGRYQKLPYWTLVPNMERDSVVVDAVLKEFYSMESSKKISKIQEYLVLSGYGEVSVNGQMDAPTTSALSDFAKNHQMQSAGVDENTYLKLFESVPIRAQTLSSRQNLNNRITPPVQLTAIAELGHISLTTAKTSYRIGEEMAVSFSLVGVNKPMHVTLVVVNSKGEVSMLYPNPYQTDTVLQPNSTISIPPNRGKVFTIKAGSPIGTDKIHAIASEEELSLSDIKLTPSGDFDIGKMSKYPFHTTVQYTINQ